MERNTVERTLKTEIDTRTEQKGVGKLDWFMSKTSTPVRQQQMVPHAISDVCESRLAAGFNFLCVPFLF